MKSVSEHLEELYFAHLLVVPKTLPPMAQAHKFWKYESVTFWPKSSFETSVLFFSLQRLFLFLILINLINPQLRSFYLYPEENYLLRLEHAIKKKVLFHLFTQEEISILTFSFPLYNRDFFFHFWISCGNQLLYITLAGFSIMWKNER